MLEEFRDKYQEVAVEVVESTTRASCASVHQRMVDIAFVARTPVDGSTQSLPLHDEPMIVVLPKSHHLAGERSVTLEELLPDKFILSAGGLGPDIEDHLVRCMSDEGAGPNIQLQRVSQCNLINMVALGFGVTIVVGPFPRAEIDGVVPVTLTSRNVIAIDAIWMESNPNPALKGLLNIVRKSRRIGAAT